MHGKRTTEKAKDFKGTFKKLLKELSVYKIGIFFVIINQSCFIIEFTNINFFTYEI